MAEENKGEKGEAYTTISRELADQYPALAGRVGESITAADLFEAKSKGVKEGNGSTKNEAPKRARAKRGK